MFLYINSNKNILYTCRKHCRVSVFLTPSYPTFMLLQEASLLWVGCHGVGRPGVWTLLSDFSHPWERTGGWQLVYYTSRDKRGLRVVTSIIHQTIAYHSDQWWQQRPDTSPRRPFPSWAPGEWGRPSSSQFRGSKERPTAGCLDTSLAESRYLCPDTPSRLFMNTFYQHLICIRWKVFSI